MSDKTDIGGVIRDTSELDMTAADRNYRGAWQLTGDVVSLDVDAMRPIAKAIVDADFKAKARTLTAGYTDEEIFTWGDKKRAARKIKNGKDNLKNTAEIDAEATVRGITRQQMVDKILAKADAFTVAMAGYVGVKAKAFMDIDAAKTPADIKAIIDGLP